MRFIGITGGVGAGKSELLAYLRSKPGVRVMLADEIAHLLMEPGQTCYHEIVEHFSEEKILNEDLTFNRNALADRIFSDKAKREELNAIVHPAVKKYVLEQYNKEKKEGRTEFLFLEAALLIEEHYDEICDELWYVYTSEANRRQRLKASRGYTDEKVDAIMASQLPEEEFRRVCRITIDNNGSVEQLYEQIEEGLRNG